MGSTPGLGRPPGERHGNLLQHSCLEHFMDRGGWWTTVRRVAESDTTEEWKFLAKVPTRCARLLTEGPAGSQQPPEKERSPLGRQPGHSSIWPPAPHLGKHEPSSSWGHARVTRTQQSDSEVLKRLRPLHLSAGCTVH